MIKDINLSFIMYKIPLKRLMLIFYLTPKAFSASLCCPGMYLQLACKTLLLIFSFFFFCKTYVYKKKTKKNFVLSGNSLL